MKHRNPVARRAVAGAIVVLLGLVAPAAEAGDIGGAVQLVGTPPPPAILRVTADETICGPEPTRPSDALVLSATGGVKNAVVFIGSERMEGWRSPTTVQIDQRRCTFVPRVTIVPPGSTIEVLNSDGILHNFHTLGAQHRANVAQPGRMKRMRVMFEAPEFVPVKCDIHGDGVMRAWVVVASHPYYALTDDEGRFRLPDLPPGPHVLEIWHEVLGTKRLPVTVGATGEIEVTVTYDLPRAEGQR